MIHTHVRPRLAPDLALGGLVALLAVLLGVDLAGDVARGTTGLHAAIEASAIVAAAAVVTLIARRVRTLTREAHELRGSLAASRADADRWQRDADHWRHDAAAFITGLGAAIDQQFERWGLSAAEKEVALLLLKGLGHKEIADLRGVSETTVRQQAASVYRKGGLTGRHELAAFFLEDLLEPRADVEVRS